MDGFLGELNRILDRFLTPAVKTILLINVAVWLALFILGILAPGLTQLAVIMLSQFPELSVKHLYIWQFLTYMFMHVEFYHLLMNMLGLWFFAPELENRLGTRGFWKFYLTVGIGAGILHAIIALATGRENNPIIGASGVIYGIMLAFAAFNPNQIIYFNMLIPIKAKYFVMIMAFFIFTGVASNSPGNISNLTHLTGLIIAYVYLATRLKEWDIRRWQWR